MQKEGYQVKQWPEAAFQHSNTVPGMFLFASKAGAATPIALTQRQQDLGKTCLQGTHQSYNKGAVEEQPLRRVHPQRDVAYINTALPTSAS